MSLSRGQFVALMSAIAAVGSPGAVRAAQPPWFPLPPALPVGKGRGLVLSGAGARGAYEAGALKWLFRNVARAGQPFDVICGTSAGAINSAFSAIGTPAAIADTEVLWKGMPNAGIVQFEPQVQSLVDAAKQMQEASKHGYPARLSYFDRARHDIKDAGPPDKLAKLLGLVSDDGIDNLVRKYQSTLMLANLQTSVLITATNVTELTSDSFYRFVGPDGAVRERDFIARSHPQARLEGQNNAPPIAARASLHHALTDDNFIDAVLASAAVPGVFQPIAVKRAETGDTNLYVDGGVANNTPVSLAVMAGATDVTVLMANASDERPPAPTNIAALLMASSQITQRRLLEGDTLLALAQNLLGRTHDWTGLNPPVRAYLESLHRKDWKPITLRLIRPRTALALSVMGFNDQDGINAAFDQGYADAQDEWVYTIG